MVRMAEISPEVKGRCQLRGRRVEIEWMWTDRLVVIVMKVTKIVESLKSEGRLLLAKRGPDGRTRTVGREEGLPRRAPAMSNLNVVKPNSKKGR